MLISMVILRYLSDGVETRGIKKQNYKTMKKAEQVGFLKREKTSEIPIRFEEGHIHRSFHVNPYKYIDPYQLIPLFNCVTISNNWDQ